MANGLSLDLEGRLHLSEDKDFHQVHELAIKAGAGLKNVCQGSKIGVSVRLLSHEGQQLRRENQQKRLKRQKHMVEARKLGFPNVILPGDVR